jgi:hypothetical protein
MSSAAIPPLPPGYRLDRQAGNKGGSAIPPLPPGYKLDQPSTANHPPLPPGYRLDQPQRNAQKSQPSAVTVGLTAGLQGMGILRPGEPLTLSNVLKGHLRNQWEKTKGAAEEGWNMAKQVAALVQPPNFHDPGEVAAFVAGGPESVVAYRLAKGAVQSHIRSYQAAKRSAEHGDTAGSMLESVATGIPVVGPMATNIYEMAKRDPNRAEGAGAMDILALLAPDAIGGLTGGLKGRPSGPVPEMEPPAQGGTPVADGAQAARTTTTGASEPAPETPTQQTPETPAAGTQTETAKPEQAPMASGTGASRPRQPTPEQEAVSTVGNWVRNPETGKMELVPEMETVTNPKPPRKTPRKDPVKERPDPQDKPIESNRPKTPKDRSLEGTQEQLEGVQRHREDKIKEGAGAGERDEQPGSYVIRTGKSEQADQHALDNVGSLKDSAEEQQQKDTAKDEKQTDPEEDEKPDDE